MKKIFDVNLSAVRPEDCGISDQTFVLESRPIKIRKQSTLTLDQVEKILETSVNLQEALTEPIKAKRFLIEMRPIMATKSFTQKSLHQQEVTAGQKSG